MITNPEGAPVIYIVSDALGETAEFVARAAASQFDSGNIEIRRVPYVNDFHQIKDVVEEAASTNSLIVYTLVLEELKNYLVTLAGEWHIPTVDILGPMIRALTKVSKDPPRMEPGLLRRLDEEYFRKIEAIEFAVKYDDGKDPRGLLYADIILVGISRTSKTPVSMYLAHKRIKTANIPLVPEVAPPEELFHISPKKIIGLTITPNSLNEIRQERLKILGLAVHADYASLNRILKETTYAEEVIKSLGCPVVDVTNRAVEETASEILEIYYKGDQSK
jgi:hypothetical protein